MKQLVLTLGTVAILATSCGVSTKAPQNTKDTAAYSVGVLIGSTAQMRDSATNYEIISEAFNDVMSGKSAAKVKEMETYMMAVQFATSVKGVDSTFDINVINAGVIDVFNKKQILTPEEADKYVMDYRTNKLKAEAVEYFKTIDATEGVKQNEEGLRYIISNPGEQPLVGAQDTVFVHYTLYDSKNNVIESSLKNNTPFKVEPNGTIRGFAQGTQLLGKGGKATIWVPSELGYNNGNALKFDIEIIDVLRSAEVANAAK